MIFLENQDDGSIIAVQEGSKDYQDFISQTRPVMRGDKAVHEVPLYEQVPYPPNKEVNFEHIREIIFPGTTQPVSGISPVIFDKKNFVIPAGTDWSTDPVPTEGDQVLGTLSVDSMACVSFLTFVEVEEVPQDTFSFGLWAYGENSPPMGVNSMDLRSLGVNYAGPNAVWDGGTSYMYWPMEHVLAHSQHSNEDQMSILVALRTEGITSAEIKVARAYTSLLIV